MESKPDDLRQAMRNWASGVTIVSTQHDGFEYGMTVSAFISVSLDPELVLVSLQQDSKTHELLQKSGFFGVTILGEDQQEISDRFAGRFIEGEDRFRDLATYRLVSKVALLADGLAGLDCQVVGEYPGGTHTVFIGKILDVRVNSIRNPLVYHNRTYRGLVD